MYLLYFTQHINIIIVRIHLNTQFDSLELPLLEGPKVEDEKDTVESTDKTPAKGTSQVHKVHYDYVAVVIKVRGPY